MAQFPANIDLSSLDGTTGFRISGAAPGDFSGFSVASAGDVNGDGFADLIIGAKYATPAGAQSGASYVVFGKAGGFGANIDLSTLDGANGFKLSSAAAGDHSGSSVASAGDINGDGFADVIVGAPNAAPHGSFSGASYVVFGKAGGFAANIDLSSLDGSNGFELSGAAAKDESGFSVASAGDVNGDGRADLIVGTSSASPNGLYSGASYVVFGKAGGFGANLDLSTLDGTTGFKISGAAALDYSGSSVASAGDVNGDGFADLIIGAVGADPHGSNSGTTYVVFGHAGGFAANIDPSTLDGTTGFALNGVAASDLSGFWVASAGDVNGDGYADLIVGASGADPHGSNSGAAYVVFGKASGFAANTDLSTLDGTTGFEISGVAVGDKVGRTVASAGDVNGDGFADLIVGARYADPHGSNSGASYVVFGKASGFAANIDLSTLDGTNGFLLSGVAVDDRSGTSVASAGDVNGDGFADLIVGAYRADPNGTQSGASYVVFGEAPTTAVNRIGSAASQTLAGGDFADALSGLGGNDKFYGHGGNDAVDGGAGIDTAVFSGARADYTISENTGPSGTSFIVTDLRGGSPDGTDTLTNVEKVQFSDITTSLAQYPVNIDLSTLDGTTGFTLNGVAANDVSGDFVASAGDVNGDGFADLIVGAVGVAYSSGASYVVFGRAGGFAANIELSTLDGSTGFKLSGVAGGDYSGKVVSAGDVNGDGFSDLIVGAYGADPHGGKSGASYVVFGKAGGFAADINLSTLDGSTGFMISGVAGADQSGRSVASAGDVNGDGFADLIVGAGGAHPHGTFSGASYVVFGHAGGFAANIDLSTLDGTTGFKISGVAAFDQSGRSVASAGDVNGDGFADLIIGAAGADPHGSNSGASYVVFGKAGGFSANIDLSTLDGTTGFKLSGVAANDSSGVPVASAGDVNGDGFADLIVGAKYADPHGSNSGASYVVFGHAGGFAANIDLSTLDGTTGFKLSGAAAYDQSGGSVASAGDVNGDGFADVIVGARFADPNGSNSGASYVVFGHAGGFAANIDLSTLDGTTGFELSGVAGSDYSGVSVASAGDVDGDGFADLIVGAEGVDTNGSLSGASYVVFGAAPTIAVNRVGTVASQTLAGGAFDDVLEGLGGNDNLYGNGGTDTAVFTGALANYAIVHNANGSYTVSDTRGGSPDGTDTLHDIEFFQFSDQTIAANSPPTVNHNAGLTVAEGGTGTLTATQLDFNDAEQADTAITYTVGSAPAHGTLFKSSVALGASDTFTQDDLDNGRITYTHDGSETTSDSFTFAVSDGGGGTVTGQSFALTVTPVNDPAVISGTVTGSVTEAGGVANGTAGTPTASATLTDADVDNTPNTFQPITAGAASANGYGTYAMAADGTWTYTLDDSNASVQGLNVGGTLSDSFTVATADGTTQVVTVAIHGANDAAVISGTAAGSVTEAGGVANGTAGAPTASATLTDTDVDDTADTFQPVSAGAATANGYGTYAMTVNGTWTYTLDDSNASVQALNVGGTLSDSFTVATADGTTQLITVTIHGADDAAVAQADHFATNQNAALAGLNLFNDNGSGADSNPDGGPGFSVIAVTGGSGANVGTQFALTSGALLTVHADGTFAYDPNHAFDSLHLAAPGSGAANTSTTDSFTYTLTGGSTATATVTVNGVNDANTIYEGTGGDDTISGDATLGGLFDLSQGGNDHVTGGTGNDGFKLGGAFTSTDRIDGGGGSNNQVQLDGTYGGTISLDGTAIKNVQVIAFGPTHDYTVATADSLVDAGQIFSFWSVSMGSGHGVSIDGHLESDGQFRFFLGQGNDTAIGGSGADLFYGDGGADTLTGNDGADAFAYLQVSDSHGNADGTAYDRITDFTAGTDKILLTGTAVTQIDTAFSAAMTGNLDASLDALLGNGQAHELDAGHAVLVTATAGGSFANHTFLVVGTSGAAGGYTDGADYVFDVTGGTLTALSTSDFI